METDHISGDILVDEMLSEKEIQAALSSLLTIPPDKVVICNHWEDLPKMPDTAKVYCRYWHPAAGEFRTVLDIPALDGLPCMQTAPRLALLLGCRLLVCDGSINPYSYLLFDSEAEIQSVSIDVNAFDRNEFVIARG